MTEIRTPPTHSQIAQAMKRLGLPLSAAEFDGELCGLMVVQGAEQVAPWVQKQIGPPAEGDLLAMEAAQRMIARFAEMRRALDEASLNFQPLLPDDELPLVVRSGALAEWCSGFLHGFAEAGGRTDERMVGEFLHDVVEIARLQHAEDDDGEEAEQHFMQLVEYIRAGVMIVRDAMPPPQANVPASRSVH